jgi:hypothetical protein
MQKPPEEGQIWEWRAFGPLDQGLKDQVKQLPVRAEIQDAVGEDIYFISPANDQNVKLRIGPNGWVLKFKILLETRAIEGVRGAFELYNESARLTYQLPVSKKELSDAADLLGVSVSEGDLKRDSFGVSAFFEAFARLSPPVTRVPVKKRRSQYQYPGGWIELAEVSFDKHETETISIHSPSLAVAEEMLGRFQPDDQLEPMNYVQACRRWSS